MTWAPGPVVTRRRLGGELRRLRLAAGLRLDEVATELRCSASKISRLETGKGIPKVRDVEDLLGVYRVDDADVRSRLLEWSDSGRARTWWQEFADVLPGGVATYVEMEWDARRIHAYESHIVHGLLQTEDYARSVLRNAWPGLPHVAVERLVEVRMRRKAVLEEAHGLRFCCVLDESALHRAVGSVDVLREQLRHLIAVAESPQVDLRIVPFAAGLVTDPAQGPFAVLEFGDGTPDAVYTERSDSTRPFHDEPEDVNGFRARYRALVAGSLTEADSMPLLARAHRRTTE